ncbi:branched-chain amino acid ABC transporter permease [Nitratireductor luteus]|uniref:branched-chain amino acid ABC transporter permease n=1 Tax=Nitratireductor luteus TaxID=2976980 RepID=UPI00223ED93A|nr:branched-chain amino acid ABC transporter permease [Nitratireductor luteus]
MIMRIIFPALVLLAAINPLFFPQWDAFLTIVFAKALPVIGIILLLQAGQVSFGHAMFFAVGAYCAGFVGRWMGGGGEIVILLVAALGASVVAGLFVGIFVVRYRYIFFAMLNLAFSMVLFSLLEKFIHITGGSDGFRIARPTFFGQQLSRSDFELGVYYLALVLLVVSIYGVWRLLDSPIGHALKAIKTNETRVEYLGISPRRTLLIGYVVSAVLAGVGGAMVGVFQGIATPDYAYWTRSGEFVFVAILGGAGHVTGALAGSYVFEFIRVTAAAYLGDTWQLTLGVVLLGIILFAPSGIVGSLIKLGNRVRGVKEKRSQSSIGKAGEIA